MMNSKLQGETKQIVLKRQNLSYISNFMLKKFKSSFKLNASTRLFALLSVLGRTVEVFGAAYTE